MTAPDGLPAALVAALNRAAVAEAQVATILRNLANICDDHAVCVECGNPYCSECNRNLTWLVPSEHPSLADFNCMDNLCADCWETCRACADAARGLTNLRKW